MYAVKWPQKWFTEVSWSDVNVSDLPEKTDFNPWLVCFWRSLNGAVCHPVKCHWPSLCHRPSSTWLKALCTRRPSCWGFRDSADYICSGFFLLLMDTTLAVAAEWLHFHLSLVVLSLFFPYLLIAFQIGWHFASAIMLTETTKICSTLLLFEQCSWNPSSYFFFFCKKRVLPFFVLSVSLLRRPFISFKFQWTRKITWYLIYPWHIRSLSHLGDNIH